MRLQKQLSRKYEGKEYAKYVIVVKPKLVEKLGWKDGQDLEAEIKKGNLVVKTVAYRIHLLDKNRVQMRVNKLADRDEFLEKVKLSKTMDKQLDTEVRIIPIEVGVDDKSTTINANKAKKEIYFGKRKEIEKFLNKSDDY